MRRLVLALIAAAALPLVISPPGLAAPCWSPPVAGVVVDPFREPPCPYCAGNRGLEYGVSGSSTVRAVESGVVAWAGVVAGIRYVVVRHADGWRATYGRLSATSLHTGDVVLAGRVVGRVARGFHFGLRRGDRYIDPAPFLGESVGRRRLVPLDGRAPRPAPPPRLRCA